MFKNFLNRFSKEKSLYILVGVFLLVASLATYFISIYAPIFIKPEYSDLLPSGSNTVKYDENGQPIATSTNGQNKKSSTKNSSSSQSSSSSSTNGTNSGTTPSEDTFSVAVAFYGDSQSNSDEYDANHTNAVNCIMSSGGNPVFHVGDLMEDGTEASLNRFNNVTAAMRSSRSFFAAPGNNDRTVGDPSTISPFWFTNFSFPGNGQWYSVNYGNLHLVVLDSAFSSGSGSQLSWLASDLQSAASQSRITGVIYHHPSFDSTIHAYLRDYGVDFVVAGHYHSYSRSVSDGIYYFVTSGQPGIGPIKANIYTNSVSMTAYNNSCGAVDSVRFNKR